MVAPWLWVRVWLLWLLGTSAVPLHTESGAVQVMTDHAGAMIRRDSSVSVSNQQTVQPTSKAPGNQGTIAVLVKAENRMLWELQFLLVPSLVHNVRFETPITIMYEGDRQLVEDAARQLQGHSLLRPLRFVDVSDFFKPSQEEIAMLGGADVRMRDFGMGYRKMCEFWAVHAQTLPALTPYRYLWRLDTDSKLTEPVVTNLYGVMNTHNSVYGYMLLQEALPEACQGLQEATQAFYKADPHLAPVTPDAQTFLESFEARKCPHWNTNFQLMDLDFFRGSQVYGQYTKHLAEDLHGFVKYRWGDHIVQTLSVLMQVPPRRTLCMQPWVSGYLHQGKGPNCNPHRQEPELLGEFERPVKEFAARLRGVSLLVFLALSVGVTLLAVASHHIASIAKRGVT